MGKCSLGLPSLNKDFIIIIIIIIIPIIIIIIAVDQQHRYSNEAERANQNIYDDFKLKRTLLTLLLVYKYFSVARVKKNNHKSDYFNN